MNFEFTQHAWEGFEYWIETDIEIVRKIKELVKDIYTVSDEEIIAALRLVYERMKIVIEPSCAVPLTA